MSNVSGRAVHQDSRSSGSRLTPGDPVQLLASVPTIWSAPQTAVADLARQLSEVQVGAVVVLDGEALAGLISERDLLQVVASDDDAEDVWVADVMSVDPVQIDGIAPIGTAALTMLDQGVRHLVVVSKGRVIGIVSMRDVLRVLTDHWLRS